MKAKEYAAKYQADPSIENLRALTLEFIREGDALVKARNIKSDSQLLSILKEQNLKWQAFARLCPEISPTGYRDVTHKLHPSTVGFF